MNNEANEVQARLTKIAESGVKVSPKAREALVKKAKRFKARMLPPPSVHRRARPLTRGCRRRSGRAGSSGVWTWWTWWRMGWKRSSRSLWCVGRSASTPLPLSPSPPATSQLTAGAAPVGPRGRQSELELETDEDVGADINQVQI